MPLYFEDGNPFAQGACPYEQRPIHEWERSDRLIITTEIEEIKTDTVVDTGGVYLVCSPELAAAIDLDASSSTEVNDLNIRGLRVSGTLHRVTLTLPATIGQSVQIDATEFAPQLLPNQEWGLPPLMGLTGCLERLRFAVDPLKGLFFFGTIDADV